MNNLTVREIKLEEKEEYYSYNNIKVNKTSVIPFYYNDLGYRVYIDDYLLLNSAICYFWDLIYPQKITVEKLGDTLYSLEKGDKKVIGKLHAISEERANFKINKSLKEGFRDKLYQLLRQYYVNYIPFDSTIAINYIESLNKEELNKYETNFLRLRTKNQVKEFFNSIHEEYDKKKINRFLKIFKKKYLNNKNCENIEKFQQFRNFILKKYEKEFISYILDDNFREIVINRFNFIITILDKISDKQLLKIFKRIIRNPTSPANLFTIIDDELYLLYPMDENNQNNYLWQHYLGKNNLNIEFLAINQSKNKISRYLNTFKQHKNKIECGVNITIKNDKELISTWPKIEKESKIYLNKKEVEYNELENIYKCITKRCESKLNQDYCSMDLDNLLSTNCIYLSNKFPEIDFEKFDLGEYAHLEEDSVIFDKKKLSNNYKKTIEHLRFCPHFKKDKVKKFMSKIPKKVNLTTNNNWNLICENGHSWFNMKGKWFNEYGEMTFPGYEKMIAIEKTNKKLKENAKTLAFN